MKINIEVLDVRDLKAVEALPENLPREFKDVDILVNNAGLALGVTSVENNSVFDARTVMETNVLGVVAFTSAFLPGMIKRGDGHIINMGSIAGHVAYAKGSVYNASKFAVKGFTDAARHDLMGTPIRVTHIAPGMVQTEFSVVRLSDKTAADNLYNGIVPLTGDDIADTVIYAATRPKHVQVSEITTHCTNQAGPKDIIKAGPSLGKVN